MSHFDAETGCVGRIGHAGKTRMFHHPSAGTRKTEINVEKFGINVVIYGTKMWSFVWNILPLQSDFLGTSKYAPILSRLFRTFPRLFRFFEYIASVTVYNTNPVLVYSGCHNKRPR